MSNILAIDPGSFQSAFVVFDSVNQKILSKGILPNQEILGLSFRDFDINVIIIEKFQSYGMICGASIFSTVWWSGRFYQNFILTGISIQEIYRKDVKLFLCNSVKAKDSNIRAALLDLLGKEKTKGIYKDCWSALALCLYIEDKIKKG